MSLLLFMLVAAIGPQRLMAQTPRSDSSAQSPENAGFFSPPSSGRAPLGSASWKVEAAPEAVHPGEQLTVTFHAEITDGWHMYALDSPVGQALQIQFDTLATGLELQRPFRQSVPTEAYDPNFRAEARFYNDQAKVRIGIQVADDVEPGAYALGGSIRYMVCNDQMCMPPRMVPFDLSVDVAPGPARGRYAQADWGELVPPESVPDSSQTAVITGASTTSGGGGLLAFLLLAAGAGVGALLMPCVFPMIPLTVSYFTKHADSQGASLRQAGVYGLTIVGTFTGLGALAAALLGASGALAVAANPWVNLLIGVVLVAFALSLMGLFELHLPRGLVNYFNRQSNTRGEYLGALFMGLTLTVVSFSCTVPFVGGLLGVAAQGTWAYPLLGMLVFSSVLALPFVGFALFPSGLKRLPTSGGWMNTLKVTFGFIELAAALKFFSNADLVWGLGWLSRPLVIALTVVLLALTGLYLLGKLRLPHEAPVETVGVSRILAATLFLGMALYMTPGLWGAPLGRLDAYLPPRQASDPGRLAMAGGDGKPPVAGLNWHTDDIDAAFEQAKATGTPVFVDFSGYTCTNCREMEANVFPEPIVAEHLRTDFVLLRLYTDDADKGLALRRYQMDLTGTVALPTYAVVTPEKEIVAQHVGMASPKAFDAFLEKGLQRAGAAPDTLAADY